MKCLSIRQPWAWLILHGYKNIENRTWRTKYRGPLLIHASTIFDEQAMKKFYPDIQERIIMRNAMHAGEIIGVVDLVDVIFPEQAANGVPRPWHEPGCFGFILENPRSITPIPYRGQLNIFEVDDALLASRGFKL